eukprot:gene12385-6052_t
MEEEKNKTEEIKIIEEKEDLNKKREREDKEEDKPKKRSKKEKPKKYVLLIAYIGTKYSGIQINPGVTTIEEVVLNTLWKIQAISTKSTKDKTQLSWHRCCRTDSGVHAARNILTAKLFPEKAEDSKFLDIVNEELPNDVELIEIQRVKDEFNPKNFCKRRVYEYLMPTKILKRNIIGSDEINETFSQNDLDNLNKLLKKYEGTHSFHNFTTKVKNTDPSAKRHMVDLKSSKPFKINEKEYVSISIYGGSFMLHQIRRMMGLIIGIMRGHVDEFIIERSLSDKYYVTVPEAPGHCLILLNQEFPGYDKVRINDDLFKPLLFNDSKDRVHSFRKKIYIEIEQLDEKNLYFADWVFQLDFKKNTYYNVEKYGDKMHTVVRFEEGDDPLTEKLIK